MRLDDLVEDESIKDPVVSEADILDEMLSSDSLPHILLELIRGDISSTRLYVRLEDLAHEIEFRLEREREE